VLLLLLSLTAHSSTTIGVGDGGREGAVALPPNSGGKVFFGQTSCNIRAVDIFLEEGSTGTLYFLTVFCFSFHVYVEYSFEFRNPFLAARFINLLWILHGLQSPRPHGDRTPVRPHKVSYKVSYIFGQKCLPPNVN